MDNLVKTLGAGAKRRMRPGIELAALSDIGCQRENNEDSYSYWEPEGDRDFQRLGRLITIADGMGGYAGGQEASHLAVATIEQVYAANADGNPTVALATAFRTAHQRIKEYADSHPTLRGMGTTCTAVVLIDHDLYYAHVGDSRLYLSQHSKVFRITRDQTYVGRLVEQGILNAEEAGSHPQRNILTGALGAGQEVAPESPPEPITLEEGDVLILCTDGLWSLVSETEIKDALSAETLQAACRSLIKIAKDRGGPDNITVQMVRIA
jgi:PPM family protein phosphatase